VVGWYIGGGVNWAGTARVVGAAVIVVGAAIMVGAAIAVVGAAIMVGAAIAVVGTAIVTDILREKADSEMESLCADLERQKDPIP
jgi:hypothetical protein